MTRRIRNHVEIAQEAPTTCEFCQQEAETRPYGPDGRRICYDCGMSPEYKPEVERRFYAFLNGE